MVHLLRHLFGDSHQPLTTACTGYTLFSYTRGRCGVYLGAMKCVVLIALLLTAWAVPLAAQDEKIDHSLLVDREGILYKKFSDTPFTGATVQNRRNHFNFKNGLGHGPQLYFYRSGQLQKKFIFKNGNVDEPFVEYYEDGKVKNRGAFAEDEMTGTWTSYF